MALRIATNACLTALAHSSRRMLPSGLGGPADDPCAEPVPAPVVAWLSSWPAARARPSSNCSAAVDDFDLRGEPARAALVDAASRIPTDSRPPELARARAALESTTPPQLG